MTLAREIIVSLRINTKPMLEYNTSRNKLIIREYGRHIQKMIAQAVQIEDREKRNEVAKAIIKAMSQVVSSNGATAVSNNNNSAEAKKNKEKDSPDYWRKLWDHLFIISEYQLDVDSPFPKPEPEVQEQRQVTRSEYKKSPIKVRTYGRNMERIIKAVSAYPDGPEKSLLIAEIALQMKKLYLTWNRDTVEDSLIVRQLFELSDGKLSLPDDYVIDLNKDALPKNNQPAKTAKKRKKKKKKKAVATATESAKSNTTAE